MKGPAATRRWLGFAGWGLLATAATGALGVWLAPPAVAGTRAAIWAGCLASCLGGLAGSIPLAREVARGGTSPIAAIGKAGLVRFVVALAAGLTGLGFAPWPARPLLFALAASYVVLLAVETWWLLRLLRSAAREPA